MPKPSTHAAALKYWKTHFTRLQVHHETNDFFEDWVVSRTRSLDFTFKHSHPHWYIKTYCSPEHLAPLRDLFKALIEDDNRDRSKRRSIPLAIQDD